MVVDAPETRIVNTFRVSCDGGGGALATQRFGFKFQWIKDG